MNDPLAFAIICLKAGAIVAIKGVGGYHLACNAERNHVVRELRRRKRREVKPLAIMVQDLKAVERLCQTTKTVDYGDSPGRIMAASPRWRVHT